jgi:hypothetical protein
LTRLVLGAEAEARAIVGGAIAMDELQAPSAARPAPISLLLRHARQQSAVGTRAGVSTPWPAGPTHEPGERAGPRADRGGVEVIG